MSAGIQVFGEFHISNSLARRVQRAVEEFVQRDPLADLSHVDENCALCRESFASSLSKATGAGISEVLRAPSEPDRARGGWVA